MGSKYDDAREDIQNCFKLVAKLDAKYESKIEVVQERQSEYSADIKLLAQGLETIAKSVSSHVEQFEKHNEDEMRNYEKTQEHQAGVVSAIQDLKHSVDSEVSLNKDRDERLDKHSERLDKIQNTQTRAIKYSAYAIGGFSTVTFLIKLGVLTINVSGG